MLSVESKVKVKPGQLSSNLDDEVVILNLEEGMYYGMNDVSSLVWNMIQEPCVVEVIIDKVMEEYDVPKDQCQTDILSLLKELQEKNLIEVV